MIYTLLLTSRAAHGAEASYLTILMPGALGTFPMAINNSMTVTGYYTTSPSTASAFTRAADGTLSTFNLPGALWTEPESINDLGDIAGFYEVVAGVPQSFLRYASGRVVTFDPPTGICIHQSASQPMAINNFDEIIGNYPAPCYSSATYERSRTGTISVGKSTSGAAYGIGLTALNSSGTTVGYSDGGAGSVYHDARSFAIDAKGYGVADLFVPVTGLPVAEESTIAEAINDSGVVAGWYSYGCHSPSCPPGTGGFVRSPQGAYTVFNPPGTLLPPVVEDHFSGGTPGGGPPWPAPKSLSLNASGSIASTYTDSSGVRHGFVRTPYGTITPFDPPRGMQTTTSGINDAGVIIGSFFYTWNSQTSIGFVRVPSK